MKFYKAIIGSIFLTFTLVGCSTEQPVENQTSNEVQNPSTNQNLGSGAGSSISLANSYDTLEDLTETSDLIAEVNINGVHSEREEQDSTLYNATLTDVLKGSPEEKEIIITQLGIKNEAEQTQESQIARENPLMEDAEQYVLFLKKGEDDQVGDIYYVSGEYQGKYQIQNQQVFSVNQNENTPKTISGENLPQFKEKITNLVQTES